MKMATPAWNQRKSSDLIFVSQCFTHLKCLFNQSWWWTNSGTLQTMPFKRVLLETSVVHLWSTPNSSLEAGVGTMNNHILTPHQQMLLFQNKWNLDMLWCQFVQFVPWCWNHCVQWAKFVCHPLKGSIFSQLKGSFECAEWARHWLVVQVLVSIPIGSLPAWDYIRSHNY